MTSPISDLWYPATEETIEAEAFIDLHKVSPTSLKEREHFDCLPIAGGCAISLPSAPAMGLNRMLALSSVDELETAYAWMRTRSGNRFLQVNTDRAPTEVGEWIRAKGLSEQGPGWAKLVSDGASRQFRVPSSVRTREVGVDEAMQFGTMMCMGFNFPQTLIPLWAAIVGQKGWGCFFALDGDTPIGTGAIYMSGTYAWLGGGTTLPEFRNRGVQKSLIQARLDHGMERGVTTFAVETEAPSSGKQSISYDNLGKMGFQHTYDRKSFRL